MIVPMKTTILPKLFNMRLHEIIDTFMTESIGYDELPDTKGNWAPYVVRRSVDADGRDVFNVFHQAHKIASATLSSDKSYVGDVEVQPEHQRRGIAKALYKHIERVLGYPLKPSPLHQTDAGRALWSQR